MKDNTWEIVIDKFEGFIPSFWKNSNPMFGNKGHASDMTNCDLTDPSVLTQGPGLVNLTDGTQASAVTTLIKGILRYSKDGTNAYAVGGNKLYKFTSSAVISDATWPHTIDKATVTGEDGEDVCYYNGYYFYSYNHSGSMGDIGRTDGTTFDDDYMSTVPSGKITLVGGVPHPMLAAGDDVLYIGNGRYVASYDYSTSTFVDQMLDLPADETVTSLAFENNRLYVTTKKPNLTSSILMESSIYIWDTTSSSWEYQIKVPGRAGGTFNRSGIVWLFYQDITSSGGIKLAYVNGNQIKDATSFTGSIPEFYQIISQENFLMWVSSGEIWAWGTSSNELPVKLFQHADGGYATVGGLSNVFGTPIVASTESTNFKLAKFSGYDVNANWKSILFEVNSADAISYMDTIIIMTEQLSAGASLALTTTYNYGTGSDTSADAVTYDASDTTKTRWIIARGGVAVENFRLDLSWAGGSATNPVKVRKIIIKGRWVTNK